MNYEMFIDYLSKSSPKDKLFWKKEYLKQLNETVNDTEKQIVRQKRNIVREREEIKKNKLRIKDLKKHIKKIEGMEVT